MPIDPAADVARILSTSGDFTKIMASGVYDQGGVTQVVTGPLIERSLVEQFESNQQRADALFVLEKRKLTAIKHPSVGDSISFPGERLWRVDSVRERRAHFAFGLAQVGQRGILGDPDIPLMPLIEHGGLTLWLDAADSTTLTLVTGDKVSSWADKSGAGAVAAVAQTTDSRRPVRQQGVVNGLDALFHDGSGTQELCNFGAVPAAGAPFSVLVIVQPFDAGGGNGILELRSTDSSNFHRALLDGALAGDPVSMQSEIFSVVSGKATTANGFTTTRAHLVVGRVAAAASRSAQLDGGAIATDATSVSPAGLTTTVVGGPSFNGRMCELLVIDESLEALTDAQLSEFQDYAAAKWGVVLP